MLQKDGPTSSSVTPENEKTSIPVQNEVGSASGSADKVPVELDYSGAAVRKTNKEEIALVKKLDWHIMVRL